MEICKLRRIILLDVTEDFIGEKARCHRKTRRVIEAPAWEQKLTLFQLIEVVLIEILLAVPLCKPWLEELNFPEIPFLKDSDQQPKPDVSNT